MAFYDPKMVEVHVLLVDNAANILHETAKLLQFNSYKVTAIQDASVASLMLSNDNIEFDLVMVDVSSSDIQGFKLVREAINNGLTVILMSTKPTNATLVKCAIEDGAFLFMEKPIALEELKYLWQHVLREKTRKTQEKGIISCGETSTDSHNNQRFYLSRGENLQVDNTTQGMTMNVRYTSTSEVTRQKGRVERTINFDLGNRSNNNNNNNVADDLMRPKMCTEWTPELHEKFMAAVKQLGDGRCFPKEILELMNVPGLTRMQVASHLQKCRYGWQPPHERGTRCPKASKSSNSSSNHPRTRRYGMFPCLIRGSQPQSQNPLQDNNLQDQQAHIATRGKLECSQNMGQKRKTWDTTNNINLNETSCENVHGNMMTTPEQGLQPDASFNFVASASAEGPIANNFDLNDFDYDHVVSSQTSDHAPNQETEFWSSWIANFARDY